MNEPFVNRIMISISTVEWMNGYFCRYEVKAGAGSRYMVNWDDGSVDVYQGTGSWQQVNHSYMPPADGGGMSYRIYISTDEAYGLLGLKEGDMEMHTNQLIVRDCFSLQELHYSRLWSLDLSKNFMLKKLVCHYGRFDQLDLTSNISLETLDCTCCGNLMQILLPASVGLKYINSRGCANLKEIKNKEEKQLVPKRSKPLLLLRYNTGRISFAQNCLC